jgi:tetratricopeptide (TPR) repeat protein
MDRWERVDSAGSEWSDWEEGATQRSIPAPKRNPTTSKPLPLEVASEIRRAADTATAHHREVLVNKMEDAVAAYDRGRYPEAARLAKQVANETPTVAAVRQLVGLAAYRAGRWREAIRQLDAYGALTDEIDHVPALMDSHRALGKPRKVAQMWSDLRQRSPDPEVLAEARIVAAGSLADRGDLDGAVSLLLSAGAAKALRNPADRHLRQWYALGDLYERAGDLPRARELFLRTWKADPEAYDVGDRLQALGPDRSRRNRRRPTTPKSLKKDPGRPAATQTPKKSTARTKSAGPAA